MEHAIAHLMTLMLKDASPS